VRSGTSVRAAAALVSIVVLGAVTAFALPRTGRAAHPVLIATVDDAATISFTDADGLPVTSLPAGTYDIQVHDTTAFHNFHLSGAGGVDEAAGVTATAETVWAGVTFSPGAYHFQCDAHPYSMAGDFVVTGQATSTAATTNATTTATTVAPPPPPPATTTTAPPPPPTPPPAPTPVRWVVPRVVGMRLTRAWARIAAARCRTGPVSYRRLRRRHGLVVSQRPRAGTHPPRGTRVDLAVGC
jgi:hypothetical protein